MDLPIKYRGVVATTCHVSTINELLLQYPQDSRRALSLRLCQLWNWKQPNGTLRDMVCRGFLLALHRADFIKLPPPRHHSPGRIAVSGVKRDIEVDTTPLETGMRKLGTLHICEARQTGTTKLYEGLTGKYHYLGYTQPVGENLRYIVYKDTLPIACSAFCSAPRHIGCRDKYIGWDAVTRCENISGVVYNTRFLILPWVRVPHLASHLLSRFTRRLCSDWETVYSHPIYFVETFVDTERFAGTCYKAANWRYLGRTTGRGKNDQTGKANRSIKAVWGYPLCKDFREKLYA